MKKKIKTKEFIIGDLFDIHPTSAYKNITNGKLYEEDGINPVIANSAYNNGIGGFTNKNTTEKGNMITFSDTTTADSIFYQPNEFVGYPHVQGMYPKLYSDKWNIDTLLYLVTIFKGKAKSLDFDFVNKFRRDTASSMKVPLPIDVKGKGLMDTYKLSY